MTESFKYFAFISYNSKDTVWGKRLQKKLEHYRLPATLCSQHGWPRKPINPVFFAPTDIQPGGLSEELQERLRSSRHLIVICSPNSAKSEWVGKEIEFFHSLGRTKNIHFFIVDGIPHSGDPQTECFNPVVHHLGLPEILGANVHEKIYRQPWLNRERAYVQLISKLLGVEFDAIWQRRRRALFRRTVAWVVGGIAIIAALFFVRDLSQPFDVEVRLQEVTFHNDDLPPMEYAIVVMRLEDEIKSDTIFGMDGQVVFPHIPHQYLNAPVQFRVKGRDYLRIDTTVNLTPTVTLEMRRNPRIYGNVYFNLYDWREELPITDTPLQVEGIDCVSDSIGRVIFFIPLEQQKTFYHVTAPFPLANDILTMPCSRGFVIMKE